MALLRRPTDLRVTDMDRIADYRFIRPLGQGSSGMFFLAETPARLRIPDPHVAVKVVDVRGDQGTSRRIQRELRTFASVRSPLLVTLHDAGQVGDHFYYAMEHLPSGSLEAPARPLDRREILAVVADAARAAHELHEAGLAHRDIKPGTIMVGDRGGKLADLGLLHALSPGQTITGMGGMSGIGSVEYVDPAVLRGERASRASDIWALGVTLHRVLTGRSVFGELPERDPLLAVRRVLSTPPTLDERLSREEADTISACLEPDLGARLRRASDVADRLDALGGRS
jgi:serine/threonine protein kinase